MWNGFSFHCFTQTNLILIWYATAVIEYILPQTEEIIGSLLLQPRSLLIFKGDAYLKYKHRIVSKSVDIIDRLIVNKEICNVCEGDKVARGPIRMSLTIRSVKNAVDEFDFLVTEAEREEYEHRERTFYRSVAENAWGKTLLLEIVEIEAFIFNSEI